MSIMKNDKTESQLASAKFILDQLNKKEAERKEAAAEAAKSRCRICLKEIYPIRRCFGHGSGESDGAGDPSEEKTLLNDEAFSTHSKRMLEDTEKCISELDSMKENKELELLNEKHFDQSVITELLKKGLLLIDNNRASMTLTIKLLCQHHFLTKAQQDELEKFMKIALNEFNAFKKQHHLSHNCIQVIRDDKKNILSLRMTVPTLALYDAFIQSLTNNLLATLNPALEQKNKSQEEQNTALNPFSMEPKIKPAKQEKIKADEDNGKNEIFNPSPFEIQPR